MKIVKPKKISNELTPTEYLPKSDFYNFVENDFKPLKSEFQLLREDVRRLERKVDSNFVTLCEHIANTAEEQRVLYEQYADKRMQELLAITREQRQEDLRAIFEHPKIAAIINS